MNRVLFYIILTLGLATNSAVAGVVVNEVMANEPARVSLLEWIELYNDATGAANLSRYELHIYAATGSTEIWLEPYGTIPSNGYMVFCRDSIRFEEHWGDSSGVWGDHSSENYLIRQLAIRLTNSAGTVALFDIIPFDPLVVSELAWTAPGLDGHSWERFHPTSDDVEQSLDPSGSTPGRINSITPLPIDLALESVEVSAIEDGAQLGFRVVNRGLSTVSSAFLDIFQLDINLPDSLGLQLESESVGEVDSGFAVLLIGQYQFSGFYQDLIARVRVANDDRPNNNTLVFTVPGEDYPPIILSEFLATPLSGVGTEWVELKSVSDITIDLSGWLLGDSISTVSISAGPLMILPGQYYVLAKDSALFRLRYPTFVGALHQPPAWRELNNGSDSLRLIDSIGIAADRFYYDHTFDDQHTWSRSESVEFAGRWGRSDDQGGTPGFANQVRFAPEGTETIGLNVEPQIISPDGDGRDDSTLITVGASDASSYTLRIYDAQGRLVRTFEDGAVDLREQYVWRGETDTGRRLPIGIYIVYFEAVGVESIKKTIVVAR